MQNRHPGRILFEDYLHPPGMSCRALAKSLRVPVTRITNLVAGKNGMTADTAIRLAEHYGHDPMQWMIWQAKYDLEIAARSASSPASR